MSSASALPPAGHDGHYDHYDALETRAPAERAAAQFAALRENVARTVRLAPAWARQLAGVQIESLRSPADLATLPVLRKHELLEAQGAADSPDAFGGWSCVGWGAGRAAGERAARVFQSPGPIHEPDTGRTDYWRMGRALYAAGFRAGDLVHNTFSYHFTPAGHMMENGAIAIGCTVFPGGIGQTEQQVAAMQRLRADAYVGTPSFLKLILDKAADAGVALGALKKASVGGEAFTPAQREAFAAHGITALQSYGTADLGLVAYETEAREGLVVDEGVILEIVRPGTGEPLPDGEVGEVVVTTLNPDYPLIRFGTGDLSAILPGPCPSGRTAPRIRGWLGRADQTTKVRGMFVHPSQVAEVLRRHRADGLGRARLVVEGEMSDDRMTLQVECAQAPEGLAARLADTVREVTKLRAAIVLATPDSLPNDGRVIEDRRSYR